MRKIFLFLSIFLTACSFGEEKDYQTINVTVLTLENGMRVLLKPTLSDSEEIAFMLAAPNGYASFGKEERPSARLAARMALRSGPGALSYDELAELMYEKSFEMVANVGPFSRSIEGVALKEGVEPFLKMIRLFFTETQLTGEAFDAVVKEEKEIIRNRPFDLDQTFESLAGSLNTQKSGTLKQLTLHSLERVEFEKAQRAFQKLFFDPSDFYFVVVGSFNLNEMKQEIIKQLGAIPHSQSEGLAPSREEAFFPKGIVRREAPPPHRSSEVRTLLTFPVKISLNEKNYQGLQLAAQIIEARLREMIREKYGRTLGVDVAYELPFYPRLSPVWIAVQFHSSPEKVKEMEKLVVGAIRNLQEKGPTEKEIAFVRNLQKNADEFWLGDNSFWLANLTNYALWGWDPDSIVQDYDKQPYLEHEKMKELLKNSISTDNYTVLSERGD